MMTMVPSVTQRWQSRNF